MPVPMRTIALLLFGSVLLSACGERHPQEAATPLLPAARYFPLEEGRRWTYHVRTGGDLFMLLNRRFGGDVRHKGATSVPYAFLYGASGPGEPDLYKSIYALPTSGVEEFFVSGPRTSMQHAPPVALLPEARIGSTWSWSGKLSINRDELTVTTSLEVVAREQLEVPAGKFDTVRIVESAKDPALRITRWLAPDVGLVKLVVKSPQHAFSFELVSDEPPSQATASR